ncbi:MAG: hypothetical protein BGO55_01410 [Sphingobacteriales bacterium 50-39]|nr:hypothetical protein [Sphingobacteriales bacterium]OJW53763.1 MAG: hypothetical protein BGO55_01410 [Sphingobacteriales bacterium 50-39]
MEDLRLDRPVRDKKDDNFQRYEFSKRVASIINKTRSSKSLVVGIYGKWGEGKSSVLNFISEEIDSNAIKIDFNPWYFQEDKQLIKSFFESIAGALGKKLTTKKEAIAKAFEDYGDSIGNIANLFIPYGVGALFGIGKKIGSKFKNDSLEHYKRRIEDFIIEADCNFVVFIDDIDRLNIDEIQSVFKLVKLVGDFPRFSYILAFDDELVASSLGHKFGNKGKNDGYDFLEKIIQLPLNLPKADLFALRKYSLKLIDEALNGLQVELTKKESQEFLGKYDLAFVPGLKSPRLAVRFANSIRFSIPLVLGEVNIGDLMIIEGIKVFYPELYSFIRNNSSIFLNRYDNPNYSVRATKEDVKREVDSQLQVYGNELSKKLREMLCVLFPQLNGLYNNYFSGQGIVDGWYKQMKICSVYYFDRYFSLVVKDGDISDVYFSQLFSDIEKTTADDFYKKLHNELDKLSIDDFIFKLRFLLDSFTVEAAKTLYLSLSMIGKLVPVQRGFQLYIPRDELAKIIKGLVLKLERKSRVDECLEAIKVSDPFNYSLCLYSRFIDKHHVLPEEMFLSTEEATQLGVLMVEKFKKINEKIHVFVEFSDEDLNSAFTIFDSLGKNEEITDLLELEFVQNPQFPLKLIKIFTPTIYISGKPDSYKPEFSLEDYFFMKRFIDPGIVYKKITSAYGKIHRQPGKFFSKGDVLSDMELIMTFQKIHENNQENESVQ